MTFYAEGGASWSADWNEHTAIFDPPSAGYRAAKQANCFDCGPQGHCHMNCGLAATPSNTGPGS